jgi:hypothetical protein
VQRRDVASGHLPPSSLQAVNVACHSAACCRYHVANVVAKSMLNVASGRSPELV